MIRRLVPYAVALATVAAVAAALGVAAWAMRLPRLDTFLLVFVLLAGTIAWRLGRGPAVAATAAFALVSDYFFIGPQPGSGTTAVSDTVALITGVLAAAAVIEFVHVARHRQILLERRKDLLQDVSPRIIQSLDAEEILKTGAGGTLRVIDYHHFRLYRWDEVAERLVLAKSIARADRYRGIDWHTVTLALGEGISGTAAQSRRSILVPDASHDARMVYPSGVSPIKESVLSVPMVTQNRLFGVLSLARLRARSLSLEDVPVMESIAAQTALALANAEQYAEAEQTIKALAMIETLQPPDGGLPDADIDQRILQGFVDLSQADLALLRRLEADKRYHVAAVGGRSWPKNAVSTGEPLTAAQVAWLSDPKVTGYVAGPGTDQKLPA